MEAPQKRENETYAGLPDSVETDSIFSEHQNLKLEHSGSRQTYVQ